MPGISELLGDFAIRAKWGDKNIRVLNPISMLASKLELVATFANAFEFKAAFLNLACRSAESRNFRNAVAEIDFKKAVAVFLNEVMAWKLSSARLYHLVEALKRQSVIDEVMGVRLGRAIFQSVIVKVPNHFRIAKLGDIIIKVFSKQF